MTGDRKPFFRFNPNAYEPGRCFAVSQDLCELCRQPCTWRYTGNLYARERPDIVCAACIKDGSVARAMEGGFGFHDIELEGASPQLEDELLQRTPGVACFNPFPWPVLDGTPLAFLHYGEDDAAGVWELDAVKQAIAEAFAELGETEDGPGPYVLLFKEIAGDRYRVVIDLD